jgi:hypothetical protein
MRLIAVGLVSAAVLMIGAGPPRPARKVTTTRIVNVGSGGITLPGGKSYPIFLSISEWEGSSFRGAVTINLGLRVQVFRVEGAIDPEKGRISFRDLPGPLHPHSPVLGRGRYEGRLTDTGIVGTALLWPKRGDAGTAKAIERLMRGEDRPVECPLVITLYKPLRAGVIE